MRGAQRVGVQAATVLAAVMALSACEPRAPRPDARPAPETTAVPDFAPMEGRPVTALSADPVFARFSPGGLGLSEAEQARVGAAMSVSESGVREVGGGVRALVFRGCAATGCADGFGVLAIDAETGGAFLGVRDAGGSDVLAPNERMEALLRLSSPTRSWDDPAPAPASTRP